MALTTLNTAPIFTGTPRVSSVQIPQATATVNSQTGGGAIGTNTFIAFTSGASGSYLQKIRFQYTSTTNVINSVLTAFKVYISTVNTGTPTTSQIALIADVQAPAQTIGAVSTSAYPIDVPLNVAIPANNYILVTQTVAQTANSAWVATVFGGDY